jgi:hypothetical protein
MHVFHDAMLILEGDLILLIGHIFRKFFSRKFKFYCTFSLPQQADNSE